MNSAIITISLFYTVFCMTQYCNLISPADTVLFCYHVETTLKGIILIRLTWFPHSSKKSAHLKRMDSRYDPEQNLRKMRYDDSKALSKATWFMRPIRFDPIPYNKSFFEDAC